MEPEITEVEGHLAPLKKITPLSKYLALALFVILPFLGGWIGYTYAPEKVVEVEIMKVEEQIVKNEDSVEKYDYKSGYAINKFCTGLKNDMIFEFADRADLFDMLPELVVADNGGCLFSVLYKDFYRRDFDSQDHPVTEVVLGQVIKEGVLTKLEDQCFSLTVYDFIDNPDPLMVYMEEWQKRLPDSQIFRRISGLEVELFFTWNFNEESGRLLENEFDYLDGKLVRALVSANTPDFYGGVVGGCGYDTPLHLHTDSLELIDERAGL